MPKPEPCFHPFDRLKHFPASVRKNRIAMPGQQPQARLVPEQFLCLACDQSFTPGSVVAMLVAEVAALRKEKSDGQQP